LELIEEPFDIGCFIVGIVEINVKRPTTESGDVQSSKIVQESETQIHRLPQIQLSQQLQIRQGGGVTREEMSEIGEEIFAHSSVFSSAETDGERSEAAKGEEIGRREEGVSIHSVHVRSSREERAQPSKSGRDEAMLAIGDGSAETDRDQIIQIHRFHSFQTLPQQGSEGPRDPREAHQSRIMGRKREVVEDSVLDFHRQIGKFLLISFEGFSGEVANEECDHKAHRDSDDQVQLATEDEKGKGKKSKSEWSERLHSRLAATKIF
jgi:hypothetical protein